MSFICNCKGLFFGFDECWFPLSSSSCRAISMDIPDPLLPPPIVHCFRLVFKATFRIGPERLYIRSSRPTFTRLCKGVHSSTSLISSSLFLQQCPSCLVRLILIVFMMDGRWPYSCCFVRCCLQDLFNIARSKSLFLLFLYSLSLWFAATLPSVMLTNSLLLLLFLTYRVYAIPNSTPLTENPAKIAHYFHLYMNSELIILWLRE